MVISLNNSHTKLRRYISIGYSTIETKEVARIGNNGFLFPHEYSGESRGMYLTCTIIVIIVLIQLHVYNSYLLLFDLERSSEFYKGALD
jgi:hypothetical protein